MRIRILGIGMGPQHLTAEVAAALQSADYVIAPQKSEDDELLAVRRAVAASYGLEVVAIADPPREREPAVVAGDAAYHDAVRDWHRARAHAYENVLTQRGGTAAMLVWGDPSLYDGAIRLVEQLAERQTLEWDVLPGISAPQLLAARHRIVLHEIGESVIVTTARRMRREIDSGATNLVVMLGAGLNLDGLDDWSTWWGANLGTDHEQLLAGPVGEVSASIEAARSAVKNSAGWVMDIALMRAP